jgi:4-amino-4-deoxy-L-arabinose transferase-like glycosyltransferase
MSKQIIILLLILTLAFTLRVYRVTEVPPSLNWDEVSISYNAYSILKTGHDEWGEFLPLHYRSFGEYKLPIQIYASIPGIALFGLNEFGVRITPVVYGTLTVLLAYFLGVAMFKRREIGLIASFLLAISPWHIQLTRGSFEASFATFWISLGILLFVLGFQRSKLWILSVIPFAISVYTYNSARVFSPLFLTANVLGYIPTFLPRWKTVVMMVIVISIILAPLVPFVISGDAKARYKLVSITDDPGLIPRINEHRGQSTLPQPLPRLVHNKVTYVSFYYAEHYLAHFSPDFLFIHGAPHKQHHVQGMGEFYLFEAPFMLLGLYLLFRKKEKFRYLLLSWILLTYIPVAITNDSIPHALRTVIALPSYQLITAFGFYHASAWFLKRYRFTTIPIWSTSIALGLIMVACLYYYLHQYYVVYPTSYSRDWQYGNKQAVQYIKDHYNEYDEIVFTRHFGEPHIFTLFYLQYDPAKYQNNPNLNRFETHDWVRVLSFDKFYFPDLGDKGTQYQDIVEQKKGKKLLFIGKVGDFPKELPRLQTISFLNGTPAMEIVEYK